MSVEIIIMAFVGMVAAVVMLVRNTQYVKRDRQLAIEKRVRELGGEVVVCEQVARVDCPYSQEFNDPDSMYKFYRIEYSVDDHGKSGYGVLAIKMNWYGPSLNAKTNWLWYF